MRISPFFLALLYLTLPLRADDILLKNGRVLEGVVLLQDESQIVIEVAAGRMTLPASMVERIETSPSRLTEFEERQAVLNGGDHVGDAEGWLALAFWAADQRLDTRAHATFEKVLTIDPGNVVAQEVLGQLSDAAPIAPQGWKPPWTLLTGSRGDFATPWTLEALAPQLEGSQTGRSLSRLLSLAMDCRWAEAAWRLRDLLARENDPENRLSTVSRQKLNPVLFALEVTAHSASYEIQTLFTTDESAFLRLECVAFVKYQGSTSTPWEWQGKFKSSGDAVNLSGDRPIRFAVPFRRPGILRYLGSNEHLENDVLFEGRLFGLPKEGLVQVTWRAVFHGDNPWEEGSLPSVAQLTVGNKGHAENREAWAETSVLWRNQAASFTRRTPLPGAYFTEPHHLRSTVSREVVRFGVDLEMSESLNLPPSELLFLTLEAKGSPVVFDWISLSGPVDGTWIALQLAQRLRLER